jgi:peptidoglycan/xylan/chitin deacetylase (PgdA/CDA1 family)
MAVISAATWGADRRVAITVDDLPVGQSAPGACEYSKLREFTGRFLRNLAGQRVPVTAFVITDNCAELATEQKRAVLRMWMEAGVELGNHTQTHPDLNRTPIEAYEQNILRADAELRALTRPRYFRSPMLHTGADPATKERLEKFLAGHGYAQGVVTFDNSDWLFAYVYATGTPAQRARAQAEYVPYMESVIEFFEKRSVEVVGREIPQVLLLHANALNAEMMPALLTMMRKRGYSFITLEEALKDPAYKLPDTYAGTNGLSWIHRWAITKGMPEKREPAEPEWLVKAFQAIRSAGR